MFLFLRESRIKYRIIDVMKNKIRKICICCLFLFSTGYLFVEQDFLLSRLWIFGNILFFVRKINEHIFITHEIFNIFN